MAVRANSVGSAHVETDRTETTISKIPNILPHERVFPIQIGTELFKLSGASISSDSPSYFSQYFHCQLQAAEETGEDPATAIRTLYIDRDPITFRDISLHLQGYHVQPRDGTHFVRLFADAQFYNLPKLISQLYEESIFISIGHREFQIPRDIFTDPGNSPNFFSLGGYPVHIRSEAHRAELLRDCRYFNFKGLEQKLIPHHISYNQTRKRDEIALRLEDILKSGISILNDPSAIPGDPLAGWVNYARPFVDDKAAELVLEIGGEMTKLHISGSTVRAEFFQSTRARVARLFEVIATKLNLPPTTQPLGLLMASGGANSQPATPGNTPLSEDLVRAIIEPETSVTLDGKPYTHDEDPSAGQGPGPFSASPSTGHGGGQESPSSSVAGFLGAPRKRRRIDSFGNHVWNQGSEEWIIRTGQWRLRIQGSKNGKSSVECVLVAVKLDAVSSEQGRNAARGFLNG